MLKNMGTSVDLHENETLMFSISTFNSKNHHDMVMEKVDRNKEISIIGCISVVRRNVSFFMHQARFWSKEGN